MSEQEVTRPMTDIVDKTTPSPSYQGDYFTIDRYEDIEYVRTADEVLVVAIDGDDVLLAVEPAPAFQGVPTINLPGGMVEPGEIYAETANRELQEEIGFKAGRLDYLGTLRPWEKYLHVCSHVYLARNLMPSQLDGDEGESIVLKRVPLVDVPLAIIYGQIRDARVVAALYLALNRINPPISAAT